MNFFFKIIIIKIKITFIFFNILGKIITIQKELNIFNIFSNKLIIIYYPIFYEIVLKFFLIIN